MGWTSTAACWWTCALNASSTSIRGERRSPAVANSMRARTGTPLSFPQMAGVWSSTRAWGPPNERKRRMSFGTHSYLPALFSFVSVFNLILPFFSRIKSRDQDTGLYTVQDAAPPHAIHDRVTLEYIFSCKKLLVHCGSRLNQEGFLRIERLTGHSLLPTQVHPAAGQYMALSNCVSLIVFSPSFFSFTDPPTIRLFPPTAAGPPQQPGPSAEKKGTKRQQQQQQQQGLS